MNKYLEKIALTRLVKRIATVTVMEPLESLVSKGVLRSESRYAEGLAKGNDLINKRTGSEIHRVHPDSFPGKATIHSGGYSTSATKDGKIQIYHTKGTGTSLPLWKICHTKPVFGMSLSRVSLYEKP
jgi:hypothetical protein